MPNDPEEFSGIDPAVIALGRGVKLLVLDVDQERTRSKYGMHQAFALNM